MSAMVLIGSGIVLGCFTRLLWIKVHFPYQGSHHARTVNAVPAIYHPSDNPYSVADPPRYRQLWIARMEHRLEFLFAPVDGRISNEHQELLKHDLSNWNWQRYSTSEWPLIWQLDNIRAAAIA